jgi:pyruvate/2-oxoglutarate dehydrogenase complex dihydrolipoamide dehydrogenase (E3) component
MRGVQVLAGRGYFEDSKTLRVETEEGQQLVNFDNAIIAVGSKSAMPKDFDLGNPRIMTSREALEIEDIPENLLVVGGGYIGMELGTVYATLGSKVVMVEALDAILSGADPDLARPVMNYAKKAFKEVRVKTKVAKMATSGKQIKVEFEMDGQKTEELFDRIRATWDWRTPKSLSTKKGLSRSMKSNKLTTRQFMPSATSPEACCWHIKPLKKDASPLKLSPARTARPRG